MRRTRRDARATVERLASELFSNPLIESYAVESIGIARRGRPMTVRIGVVVFPGSTATATRCAASSSPAPRPCELWHEQGTLDGVAAVVLPGGFAYGDYLRAGVIARFSPVMRAVAAFAAEGGLVLGICNGFQVLAEAGLVPGALLRNRGLRFLGRDVRIAAGAAGHAVHGAGRRAATAADADRPWRGLLLRRRRDARRARARWPGAVPVRPRDGTAAGEGDPANPNGSLRAIAGRPQRGAATSRG